MKTEFADSPVFSVITVCFNESADKIKKTSDSIVSQTYSGVEWIFIDGGSKPDTIEAINTYLGKIDKFISEPDNGIYDAMNKGLSIASGDFVIFINVGDKFYSSDTIDQIVDCILANPTYDCFYGDVITIDENGKEWAAPQVRKVSRCILGYSMVCHQSIISRKALYDTVGNFDIDYKIIADRDWMLRSIGLGAKWLFTNMFICQYDMNGVSADVSKRQIEVSRFMAKNYSVIESYICFFLRKYRNLRRRIITGILRCRYKGLPVYIK